MELDKFGEKIRQITWCVVYNIVDTEYTRVEEAGINGTSSSRIQLDSQQEVNK